MAVNYISRRRRKGKRNHHPGRDMRGYGVLMMLFFWTWLLSIRVCPPCENSSSHSLMLCALLNLIPSNKLHKKKKRK